MPPSRIKQKKVRKRPRARTLHKLSLITDIDHLNTQLRSVCTALQTSRAELLCTRKEHAQYLLDIRLSALLDRNVLIKQLENERARLTRKFHAEQSRSEKEEERLQTQIDELRADHILMHRKLIGKETDLEMLQTSLNSERVRYLQLAQLSKATFDELDAAKAEVNTARDDLAELQRLDGEEKARRQKHLPPAYGSLEDVDSPPWERHCKDVGRLDGGMCGIGMTLLESCAEETFGRELRGAQARARRDRGTNNAEDPTIKQHAGANFLCTASEALAEACQNMTSGMDKIVQLERSNPAAPISRQTFSDLLKTVKKRPLDPDLPPYPSRKPIYSRQWTEEARRRHNLPPGTPTTGRPESSSNDPEPLFLSAECYSPTFHRRGPAAARNHTLAHRATTQIFTLASQILAAVHLRPLDISPLPPPQRLRMSSAWRTVEDCLRKTIEISATIPLAGNDGCGKCSGCGMPCAGNCVRMGRVQGYVDQLRLLNNGFEEMVTPVKINRLRGVLEMVEEIVEVERKCAAEWESKRMEEVREWNRSVLEASRRIVAGW